MELATKVFDFIKEDLAVLEPALLEATKAKVELVTEIGSHLVKSGGKRLRPALFFLAARIFFEVSRA